MIEDEKSATLKDLIDPEHLLRAIDNSLEHSGTRTNACLRTLQETTQTA
jgi:hypothetical protein